MTSMPLFGEEIRRQEFDISEDYTCINHGSFGALPRKVQDAQKRIMHEMNTLPDLWFRQTLKSKYQKAKECIAVFVKADDEDLVFVENATCGVNCVLKSLPMESGDTILLTDNTYEAVQYASEATAKLQWMRDVRTDYLQLKFPIRSEDEVVEMYRDYFLKNSRVKIAVIDHITSPSAIVMPIKKLITLCKEFGVISFIDGAHAPGQIPLDLRDLDADFYTGDLHKWMYAPLGCAILYVNKKYQNLVSPLVTSHGYHHSFQSDFAIQGTRDCSAYSVVPEALEFYNSLGGHDKVNEYIGDLLDIATDHLMITWKTGRLPIPQSMEAPFMKLVELPDIKGLSTVTNYVR